VAIAFKAKPPLRLNMGDSPCATVQFHISQTRTPPQLMVVPSAPPQKRAPLSERTQNTVNLPENARAPCKNRVNLPEKALPFALQHAFHPIK
jgi:hypothetical protein